nr:glycoside hydrolase family protein [Clostridia bacterium]
DGKVYLYFMMNYGIGNVWEHRNRQRIGAAWSDDPENTWVLLKHPVVDITPGGVDSLMTSNPTVTKMPDGRFLMIYKAVGMEAELPKGGPVICSSAIADSPLGPFKKTGKPLFVNTEQSWSVEDPFGWWEDGWFYALVKDYNGYFTKVKTIWSGSTALFRSPDGLEWEPDPEHPLAYMNELELEDGPQSFLSLERPQMYIEDGKPRFLLCACRFDQDDKNTYNVKIPLKY